MSDVYNPETQAYEKLVALEVQARELAQKRNAAGNADDRQIIEEQLHEVEQQIARLKRRFKQ